MAEESPLAFPKRADRPRLDGYAFYDKLYEGEHYDAFSYKGQKDFTERYKKLRYIVANFARILSNTIADMLFGEKITVDMESDDNQQFVDGLMEESALITSLYESAIGNSKRGDSLFKIRVGPKQLNDLTAESTVIIEEQNPAIYFPVFDNRNAKNTPFEDVLIWRFSRDNKEYLHKESHRPGFIVNEVFGYDPTAQKITTTENAEDFGYKSIEQTLIKKSLIVHIPNYRDGSGFFGVSDYRDLESLFFALNNRLTKIDNILDNHSDPILAVPAGVIDEDGRIKKEALGLFEVDNENPGFNKPEYIVWNANLEAAEKQVDKLIELMMLMSEMSPASTGLDKNGIAESGRALKFKMLATIRKRNRKIRYYDQGIKDILEIAQEMAIAHSIKINNVSISKTERPTIDWGDGIVNDETEMTDIAVKRVDAGLSSRAGEIAKLDGKTPDEAADKVKEIDKESQVDLPLTKSGAPFAKDKPVPSPTDNQPDKKS